MKKLLLIIGLCIILLSSLTYAEDLEGCSGSDNDNNIYFCDSFEEENLNQSMWKGDIDISTNYLYLGAPDLSRVHYDIGSRDKRAMTIFSGVGSVDYLVGVETSNVTYECYMNVTSLPSGSGGFDTSGIYVTCALGTCPNYVGWGDGQMLGVHGGDTSKFTYGGYLSPTVSSTSFSVNTVYKLSIHVTLNESNNNVEYYVNNESIGSIKHTDPWSVNNGVKIVKDGNGNFMFDKCWAYAGNITDRPQKSTLDLDSPSIYVTNWTADNINWTVQVESTEDGACSLWHNLTGTLTMNETTSVTADTPINFTTIEFLNDYGVGWRVNCSDVAGNQNTTNLYTYIDVKSGLLDIIFTNIGGTESSYFDRLDYVLFYGNHSRDNGSVLDDSSCDLLNVGNVTGVYAYENTNFTLCNAGNSCDIDSGQSVDVLGLPTTNVKDDYIYVELCHADLIRNDFIIDDLTCGGTVLDDFVINKNQIPLCEDNFGVFVIKIGDNCTAHNNITYDLYNDVTGYNSRHVVKDLLYGREEIDLIHPSLDYNSSLGWYSVNSRYYLYTEIGEKRIMLNCTNPDTIYNVNLTETITIGNIPPQISHSLILIDQTLEDRNSKTYNFNDGVVVDVSKNSNITFIVSVIDFDLENHTYLLTDYHTQDLIWNKTRFNGDGVYVHELNGSILYTGEFNFTTVAYDSDNNFTVETTVFNFTNVTDVTNPVITPLVPAVDNEVYYVNESITFSVSCYDLNLFQIMGNITIGSYDDYSTGIKQHTTQPTDTFNLTFTPNITGNGTITWKCGDSGTGIYLSPSDFGYYANKEEDKLTFTNYKDDFSFDISHAGSIPPLEDYKVTKLKDSYDWIICLSQKALAPTWTITEYIDGDFIYLENSEYAGHFVSSDGETWIRYVDSEWNNQDVISVVRTKNNQWAITTRYSNKEMCHSPLTGSTNTATETLNFEVVSRVDDTSTGGFFVANVCPDDDIPTVLMTGLIFFVLVTIFILGRIYIKFPAIDMLVGLGMLIFGGAIIGCNFVIGVVVILFGIIMFIMSFI